MSAPATDLSPRQARIVELASGGMAAAGPTMVKV